MKYPNNVSKNLFTGRNNVIYLSRYKCSHHNQFLKFTIQDLKKSIKCIRANFKPTAKNYVYLLAINASSIRTKHLKNIKRV